MLAWLSVSDPDVHLVWALAAGIGLLVLILTVALINISQVHVRQQQQVRAVEQTWKAWLVWGAFQEKAPPRLRGTVFLRTHQAHLWREALMSADGRLRRVLVNHASACGLVRFMDKTLSKGLLAEPMALEVCVVLVGLLGMNQHASALKALLKSKNTSLSFAAALALLRLEPTNFKLVTQEGRLKSWSMAALLALGHLAPPEAMDDYIEERIHKEPPRFAARLLAAWSELPSERHRDVAFKLLSDPDTEGWLLCSALRLQKDARNLPLIKGLLNHNRWAVRLQAIKAYARLANKAELQVLRNFADDENWWIRVRVAEALNQQKAAYSHYG